MAREGVSYDYTYDWVLTSSAVPPPRAEDLTHDAKATSSIEGELSSKGRAKKTKKLSEPPLVPRGSQSSFQPEKDGSKSDNPVKSRSLKGEEKKEEQAKSGAVSADKKKLERPTPEIPSFRAKEKDEEKPEEEEGEEEPEEKQKEEKKGEDKPKTLRDALEESTRRIKIRKKTLKKKHKDA